MRLMILLLSCCFRILHANTIYVEGNNKLPCSGAALYLDLMKRCVTNTIYENTDFHREEGLDWPTLGHTMIGLRRLDNIQKCMNTILKENIPGDMVETGVWRGGACIFMRAILQAYNDTSRKVWVVDSFEGLPPANLEKYPQDADIKILHDDPNYRRILSISLEQVQQNFAKYGLLDNQVVFIKGWFSQTLPNAPIQQIALLRLDGDYYESTMDSLENLYSKVSDGGFVIIDDWIIEACRKAVVDYRAKYSITETIRAIDQCAVFWRKGE